MTETVCISRLGVVTSLGSGAEMARNLLSGQSHLRRGNSDEPLPDVLAGRIRQPPATHHRRERLLQQAWQECNPPQAHSRSLVVLVGQAGGSPSKHSTSATDDTTEILSALPTWALHEHYSEVIWLSHACASIMFALDLAREALLSGSIDLAIIAGAVTLTRYEWLGMKVTGALSDDGARPFDVDRDGTTMGEGATVLTLERSSTVRARNQAGLAIVVGLDCRLAASSAAGSDATVQAECMSAACDAASPLVAAPVQYVQAHATGTVQGDEAEVAALSAVGADRGWEKVPVSSHKGATGHLMHVSAGPALVASVVALHQRQAAATVGLQVPSEWPRSIRPILTPTVLRGNGPVLVNSFGFGGNTASLVLAHPGTLPN